MTVVKSTMVTELDAHTIQGIDKFGGPLRRVAANSAKSAAHATNDIFPVLRAWTGWTLDSLLFQTAAWGASGVVEIGAYDTAENGGAAIDADAFGTAIDVSGALARIDLLMEAAGATPDELNNTLRDLLGIASTVQHKWVDICLTATHIGAAQAAKFALTLRYVENG